MDEYPYAPQPPQVILPEKQTRQLFKFPSLHFGLSNFFLLQLAIAPAFLALFYASGPPEGSHPSIMLLSVLLAPMFYTAVFSFRTAIHISDAQRSVVFAAIRTGIFAGLLYCVLALGSFLVVWIRDNLAYITTFLDFLRECRDAVIIAAYALLYAIVIGAATGGVVGLAVDRRRGLQHHKSSSE